MNPVVWFEICAEDLGRAAAFYEAVLGTPLSKMDSPVSGLEMMAFPMEQGAPGAAGALVKMDGMSPGGHSTVVYFHSEDCSQEETRIVAAGGKVFRSKESIGPYGYIVLGTDTEGNMFGVHSMV